jgi:pimeloyl-ACP methyl ester carboxylesterase
MTYRFIISHHGVGKNGCSDTHSAATAEKRISYLLRVITSGTAWLPNPEDRKAWRESHERLTASIQGSALVLAEKSGHMIPWSQPDLFVSVVAEVVRLAK